MEIQNSTIEDLDFIFGLYRAATAYQKERFISHWPEFDREMVSNEIFEKRHSPTFIFRQVGDFKIWSNFSPRKTIQKFFFIDFCYLEVLSFLNVYEKCYFNNV